jgi:hypothetical protein
MFFHTLCGHTSDLWVNGHKSVITVDHFTHPFVMLVDYFVPIRLNLLFISNLIFELPLVQLANYFSMFSRFTCFFGGLDIFDLLLLRF